MLATPSFAVDNVFSREELAKAAENYGSQDVEVLYGDTLILDGHENEPLYFTRDDGHYQLSKNGLTLPFEVRIKELEGGNKICGIFERVDRCYQLFTSDGGPQRSNALLVASLGNGKYEALKGQMFDYRDDRFYDYGDPRVRSFYETLIGAGETKAAIDEVKASFELYHFGKWCIEQKWLESAAINPLEVEIKTRVATLADPKSKEIIWEAAKGQNPMMGSLAAFGDDSKKYQLCVMVEGLLPAARSSSENPF